MANSLQNTQLSQLRLIAGIWRGRKIYFNPAHSIRPTSDRIRETLFNWLRSYIDGAKCLDLFAGSGALGFEAISQGALRVDMVEINNSVCKQIAEQKEQLGGETIQILNQDACHFIKNAGAYDIIFVDPPFNQHTNILSMIDSSSQVLHQNSLIYVESPNDDSFDIPAHWHCIKQGTAGSVLYRLYNLATK